MDERKRRIRFFKIKKADKVLDLGCGDGLNVGVLKKMGIKRVSGVDISKELLTIAKKENKHAKFYLSSAEKLPFKKGSFNVVFVDSVFHHFMKYRKALSEIRRVLVPGGRLCFIEPHRSVVRDFYDYLSTSWISNFVPMLKRRGESYKGEIKFMRHWLKTENIFYKDLADLGFNEKLKKNDILSIIGIYETPKK